MSLNKTLKALLLGSVAISLTGAGAAYAGPDGDGKQFPSDTFNPQSESTPDVKNTDNQDSSRQFPSDAYSDENSESSRENLQDNSSDSENLPGSDWQRNAPNGSDSRNNHGKLM